MSTVPLLTSIVKSALTFALSDETVTIPPFDLITMLPACVEVLFGNPANLIVKSVSFLFSNTKSFASVFAVTVNSFVSVVISVSTTVDTAAPLIITVEFALTVTVLVDVAVTSTPSVNVIFSALTPSMLNIESVPLRITSFTPLDGVFIVLLYTLLSISKTTSFNPVSPEKSLDWSAADAPPSSFSVILLSSIVTTSPGFNVFITFNELASFALLL